MDSVLAQDRSLYEWIIIDGGSSDGSYELIEQHQGDLDYWVSEPDKGIYNAMNKGIGVARGEYLLFLNSGDYLASDTVLRDIFLHDFREDILYGKVRRTSDGRIIDSFVQDDLTLLDLWHKPLVHQGMFIKALLFERLGLYDESFQIIADWTFSLKAIIYGGCTMRFLPNVVAFYEGGGISSTPRRDEEILLFKKRIPPRLSQTLSDALSKQEICYNAFFSRLYSILYRAATYFRYRRDRSRNK